MLVEDVGAASDSSRAAKGVTSEICVPLFDGSEVVGLLDMESVGGVRLTPDDLRVLLSVCDHTSVAISRARLYSSVRHSEERYQALTQNSSDLVTLMEATGIIRYQSPAIEWMLGYSPEELLGENAFDYVHPDDLQRVRAAFDEVVNDPERQPSGSIAFCTKTAPGAGWSRWART